MAVGILGDFPLSPTNLSFHIYLLLCLYSHISCFFVLVLPVIQYLNPYSFSKPYEPPKPKETSLFPLTLYVLLSVLLIQQLIRCFIMSLCFILNSNFKFLSLQHFAYLHIASLSGAGPLSDWGYVFSHLTSTPAPSACHECQDFLN